MIRHLAGSLLAALFLSGTGYALHAWAQHRLDQQRQQHGKLVAEARQARERLQRTQQDEPAVRLAIQQFDTLRAQGVIGPEHRLEWIDQLREIERSLRLPKSDFSLQPQRQLAAIPAAAPYAIYSSRMEWHAALLHEADLLRLIDRLPGIRSAVVHASACSLTDSAPPAGEPDKLDTRCQFDWLSIAPAIERKEQP